MESTNFITELIVLIIALVIFAFVMRSIFKVNEIAENQRKTVQLLIKLVELKKKELGISGGDKTTESK